MSQESQQYQTQSLKLENKGLVARYLIDDPPPGSYFNLLNVECRVENALASRFGRVALTSDGTSNFPLPAAVHSLGRLKSLTQGYRYGGASTDLFRRTGNTGGAYTQINTGLSGNRWQFTTFRPPNSANPYIFIADSALMLKDVGTLAAAQRWGVLPPAIPITAQVGSPGLDIINTFSTTAGLTFSSFTSPASNTRVNTTLGTTVSANTVATVTPASMTGIMPYNLLVIDTGGSAETVMVLSVTTTTFTAEFTKSHAPAATVKNFDVSGSVAASTIGTITGTIGGGLGTITGNPVSATDQISFWLFLDNPQNIQEIRIMFDVSDGTFTSSYYYKSVTPAIVQQATIAAQTTQQAYLQSITNSGAQSALLNGIAVNQILAEENQILTTLRPTQLNPGLNVWSLIQAQLGTFVEVGLAGQQGYTWANVNSFRIYISTNANGTVAPAVTDLFLFGGGGPDSTGGIGYDWRYTYVNYPTGAESNPSQVSVNLLFPIRQTVLLSWTASPDPQVTHVRLYRRGGTVSSGWNMIAQVPIGTTTFIDNLTDLVAEIGQLLSITNDAPVTSELVTPVNTTLGTSVTAGSSQTVTPGSMANISVNQVMTVDQNTSSQETVVVQSVSLTQFTAFFQYAHASTANITATTQTAQALNLVAEAFGLIFLAGDPNNPHYLYYSTNGFPESFPAANFLEIGTPSNPIIAMVGFQSLLYVYTTNAVYQILGAYQQVPIPVQTATSQGAFSNQGVTTMEGIQPYQSYNGIYAFQGQAAEFMSERIDWIPNGIADGPVIPYLTSAIGTVSAAYFDNEAYFAYTGTDSKRHRIIWHNIYKRWRNDDAPANCLLMEDDIPDLVYGDVNGMIWQDRVGNFDSGGFTGGNQLFTPMNCAIQTTSYDQDLPKNFKNYNEFSIDINTGGISVNVSLVFDDGQQTLSLGTVNNTTRQQIQFNINAGQGRLSKNCGVLLTWTISSNAQVNVYELHFRYIVEGELRDSFDSYWTNFGTTGWKFCKQTWVSYASADPNGITVNVYTEGNSTTPVFSFNLPSTGGLAVRKSDRIRFPAVMAQQWRFVATSASPFRLYEDQMYVEGKNSTDQKGYQKWSWAA